MSSSKEQEAQAEKAQAEKAPGSHEEAPPAYEPIIGPSSEAAAHTDKSSPQPARPTADSPFNFPSDAPLPSYSEASSTSRSGAGHPIAVPQTTPDATSPLIAAYPPSLLHYGIPKETWLSLLTTVSAFLSAKVTDRALRHVANVGQRVGEGPRDLFKGVYNHAKESGRSIGANAKRGNVLGAAAGVVGGAIGIPLHAAVGAARAVIGLPGSAVAAAARRPETPRERAEAYLGVVNGDWLHRRGLHAAVMDSQEVSRLLGVNVVEETELRGGGGKGKDKDEGEGEEEEGAGAKMKRLAAHAAELDLETPDSPLAVGLKTLWVVVTHVASAE